jgi:hypothetical protein
MENWHIDIDNNLFYNLLESINKIDEKSFILDTDKTNFNIIEKLCYEIALFHFERLNILFDSTKYIEFSFKTEFNNNLELEKKDNQIPFLKTLTYLNNSNNISLITNIDCETYKYKNFNDSHNICFSLHKKLNHISFEGGKYYHSDCITYNNTNLENKSLILILNLWDEKPNTKNNLQLNNELNFINNIITKINNNYKSKLIITNDNLFNTIFEKIFYSKNYDLYNNLTDLISDDIKNYDLFIFTLPKNLQNNHDIEVQNINKLYPIELTERKYLQRFSYKNFYNTFSCNWIINELNNYLKNNEDFIKNKNIVNVENIPNLLNFILSSFQQIINYICLSYCINENDKKFQILNVNIEKIEKNQSVNDEIQEFKNDNSNFSVKIFLNNNFENQILYFDDNITYFLEKGDLIIHNGKEKYNYKEVKNYQYILNGQINIYNK